MCARHSKNIYTPSHTWAVFGRGELQPPISAAACRQRHRLAKWETAPRMSREAVPACLNVRRWENAVRNTPRGIRCPCGLFAIERRRMQTQRQCGIAYRPRLSNGAGYAMYCRIEFLSRTTAGAYTVTSVRRCQSANNLCEMLELAERHQRDRRADGFRLRNLHTGKVHADTSEDDLDGRGFALAAETASGVQSGEQCASPLAPTP